MIPFTSGTKDSGRVSAMPPVLDSCVSDSVDLDFIEVFDTHEKRLRSPFLRGGKCA